MLDINDQRMSRESKWWLGVADLSSSSENEEKTDTEIGEENACVTSEEVILPLLARAPKGVSESAWVKFQELRGRRQKHERQITRRISKRRERISGKRSADNKPISESRGETRSKDCGTDAIGRCPDLRQVEDAQKDVCKEEIMSSVAPAGSASPTEETEQRWREVKRYVDVNEHVKGVDPGRYAAKSGLEKRIDDAVECGDFELAEQYSDHLAKRDFAVRVAKAFDCVDYVKRKNEEMDKRHRKRKRKLHWGFEGKHRWETKSNM